ncbi:chymotrypsin family serine protease [Nocardia heshunensis]
MITIRIALTTILAAGLIGAGIAVGHAAPETALLGGSSGIVLGASSGCSLAAIGYDGAGRLVGLTAGHCASEGTEVRAEQGLGVGVVGTVAMSDRGTNLDYAVVEFDAARVTPVRSVGATTIAGIGATPGPGGRCAPTAARADSTAESYGARWTGRCSLNPARCQVIQAAR